MFVVPRIQIGALVNYVAASHFVAGPTPTTCYIPFVGACCYLPLLQELGRNMPHKKNVTKVFVASQSALFKPLPRNGSPCM